MANPIRIEYTLDLQGSRATARVSNSVHAILLEVTGPPPVVLRALADYLAGLAPKP